MDKSAIQAAFAKAGLTRLLKDMNYIARPSIRLSTTPTDDANLKPGASKVGGVPDLPHGVSWPQWKGVPQSFIAQIRLDEVHPYDVENVLPAQGMLWFFYDASQQTYGDDPSNRGAWYVLFNKDNNPADLQRTQAPANLPKESQFHACSVSYATEITLSQHPEIDVPHFDWTDDEQQKYEDLLSQLESQTQKAQAHNRLLGNPDTIQDDMRSQCALVSHGITDDLDPHAKDVLKDVLNWRLLLQIDSDEHAGMRWGSTGMLYYWITQADLQAQRFDSTWLVLQSE